MHVTIVKGMADDQIDILRPDGSEARTRFPKKGPVPHDAVHFLVEDALGLSQGFWGLIAGGLHPDAVQDRAKAAGHASAKRAGVPDASIVQLLQAERLVECFEAMLWSGECDAPSLREVALAGCKASHVPLPEMSDADILAIAARVFALRDEWIPAAPGHRWAFEWSAA